MNCVLRKKRQKTVWKWNVHSLNKESTDSIVIESVSSARFQMAALEGFSHYGDDAILF